MKMPRTGALGGAIVGRGPRGPATPSGPEALKRAGNVGSTSGFERMQGSGRSTTDRPRAPGGEAASGAGFALLGRFKQLKRSTQQAAVASALGFMLLLPPGVGQLMHPGAPTASSPLSLMMSEKAELPTGARVRAEASALRREIPGGVGAARELALRALIEHHDGAAASQRDLAALSGDAAAQMAKLRESVGLDAKMGYAVDWYWFGVPPEHATYHAGVDDARAIADQAGDVRAAVAEVRAMARNEVSELLKAESPEYAQLHAKYSHEKHRLEVATRIRDLADEASDALGTASNAILMRNLTPRTIEEPVYETRTSTNADGSTRSERVQTGTRTVDNPAWHTWNAVAVAAKARAEGKIRGLNETIRSNRELLGLDGSGISADLITAWDFFGQPSFFVWSFDSQDVSRAERAADQMVGQMNGMIRQIHTVYDPLSREVEATIDARWIELGGKGDPTKPDNPNDDALRASRARMRRKPDGTLELDNT
ncbi:MAG: hypothetical protein KC933_05560 [Myxococcales bacterium]|nr:hypothetical protein [Myxococcales bacterium]